MELEHRGTTIAEDDIGVDHLQLPQPAREARRRPGMRVSTTNDEQTSATPESPEPESAQAESVRIAVDRGEAFDDVGRWLNESGWNTDRVTMACAGELEPANIDPPPPFKLIYPACALVAIALLGLILWWALQPGASGPSTDRGPVAEGEDYVVRADGTVVDHANGLQWRICPLGQMWQNASCQGEPDKLVHENIGAAVEEFNNQRADDKHSDWRAPTIAELKNYEDLGLTYSDVSRLWSSEVRQGIVGYAKSYDRDNSEVDTVSADKELPLRVVREANIVDGECPQC